MHTFSVKSKFKRCEKQLCLSSKLVIIFQNYYHLIAVARAFVKKKKKKKNWYKKNFFMNFKTLPFNQKFLKARISSFYWYMSLHLSISQLALLYYYTVNIDWNNGKIRQPYFWFYNPNNNQQKKTKWWYNNVSLIIKITGTKYS